MFKEVFSFSPNEEKFSLNSLISNTQHDSSDSELFSSRLCDKETCIPAAAKFDKGNSSIFEWFTHFGEVNANSFGNSFVSTI